MRGALSRREKWKDRVLKTTTLSHGTRLFLLHTLAKHMAADGFVCRSKDKLATQANLSERQVQRYISNAIGAGWLALTNTPGRGIVPEYQAMFPNRKRETQDVSLYNDQKGDANRLPLRVTNTSPFSADESDTAERENRIAYKERVRAGAHNHFLNPTPSSRRCVVRLGLGTNESQRNRRTSCRTQARTVERHRWRPTAAQVETHPGGTDPAKRFSLCSTGPQRKALPK